MSASHQSTRHTLREVVRHIGTRAHEESLKSDDGPGGHLAKAIGRMPLLPSVLSDLVARARSSDKHMRVAAMRSLAMIGPSAARPQVLEVLAPRIGEDIEASAAVGAMGPAAATPQVLEALFSGLDRPHSGYSTAWPECHALAQLSDAFIHTKWMERLWPTVFANGGISYWHMNALGMVAEKHPEATTIARIREELLERLLNPDAETWGRYRGASAIDYTVFVVMGLGSAASDDRLVAALVDIAKRYRSYGYARHVIKCLGAIGARAATSEALAILLECLADPDYYDRPQATLTLARLAPGFPENARQLAYDALFEAIVEMGRHSIKVARGLREEWTDARIEAGRVLSRLAPAQTQRTARCIAILKSDPDDRRRQSALEVLRGPMAPSERKTVLRALCDVLLGDESTDVRVLAANVLAEHGRWASESPFIVEVALKVFRTVIVSHPVLLATQSSSLPEDTLANVRHELAQFRSACSNPLLFEERALTSRTMPDAETLSRTYFGARDWLKEVRRLSTTPAKVRAAAAEALGLMGHAARRHPDVVPALRERLLLRGDLEDANSKYWSLREAAAAGAALCALSVVCESDYKKLFGEIASIGEVTYYRLGLTAAEVAAEVARLHANGFRYLHNYVEARPQNGVHRREWPGRVIRVTAHDR